MQFHPSGRFLYVLASSAVWVYGLDATGALAPLPGAPIETGETPWHLDVDPDGRFLYTTTPGNPSGRLGVWAVDPDRGTPSAVSGSPFACGKGPIFVARVPGNAVAVASLPSAASAGGSLPMEPGDDGSYGFSQASVSELANGLKHPDWRVRYQAAVHLSAKGADAVAAVPELTAALGDLNEPVAQRAAYALECIGPQAAAAAPALIALLQGDNPVLRRAAASAIGKIGSPEARDALAQAMQRPGLGVGSQSEAARALAAIGPRPEQLPALLAVLVNGDPGTRSAAAEMLGSLGSAAEPAVPELVILLDADQADVRKAATTALGYLGDHAGTAIPALYGGLLDEAQSVREAASLAIQRIRRRSEG